MFLKIISNKIRFFIDNDEWNKNMVWTWFNLSVS
jgi:hypothetical protein